MTYEDAMDIGGQIFDEYLPKSTGRTRQNILVALFAELREAGVLDLDDPEVDETDAVEELDF